MFGVNSTLGMLSLLLLPTIHLLDQHHQHSSNTIHLQQGGNKEAGLLN